MQFSTATPTQAVSRLGRALLNSGAMSRLQVVQGIRNSPEHFTQEVADFYLTLLNRPADPSGLQNWVQQLESGMREEQVAFDFLDSPEYLSKGDKYFVDQCIRSLLGRTFDTAGEANWLSQLGDDTSGNPTHSATLTHEQVITDFLYSTESETRLTEGYYEDYLQRPADAAGLNGWVAQLQQGVPFLTIGQQFLSSDEFYDQAAGRGKRKRIRDGRAALKPRTLQDRPSEVCPCPGFPRTIARTRIEPSPSIALYRAPGPKNKPKIAMSLFRTCSRMEK